MGKASQKKKKARLDSPEIRLAQHRCLKCGEKATGIWCDHCGLKGRQRARQVGWPSFTPPLTETQHNYVVNLFPQDPRWNWKGLIDGDLSYYDVTDPVSDPDAQEAPTSA